MISHHRRPQTRPERFRRQAGAALVELAMVALFLATLSGGAYDYGMAWRVGLATNEASRTAARTGSGMGNQVYADWYALSGAMAALKSSGKLQDVQMVVVFKSATVDGVVPADCANGVASTTQLCNVWTGAQFRALDQNRFSATTGCGSEGVTATVANWCPTSRNNVQLTADYYGVYIKVRHNHQFKMLSTKTDLARQTVMRLEPSVS